MVIQLESTPLTLDAIQKSVHDWISQFEQGYWPPLSMLAAVTEEVGELAREINDREGYKKKRVADKADLGLELADVLYSIVCIANYYHINLDDSFRAIMKKYDERDTNRWTRKQPKTASDRTT